MIIFEKIQEGDNYINGCLLDCNCFKENYKMIAIDLNKQQELESDPKAIQQINLPGNLEQQATFFFINETKERVLDFSQGAVKVF